MSGFTTTNNDHLIRSLLWSSQIKETLLDELFAQTYVDWITDFPDGDTLNIPSIGQAEVLDYAEGQAVRYTAMDTGNFTFSISKYKSSATYITEKMKQDSFYMNRLVASFVPKQARAIAKAMEVDVLACGPAGQTPSVVNAINGANHRFVGTGTSSTIDVSDFAKAKYALQKANVPMTNLVAIVDPSVEYKLSTLTNLVNVSNNPRWEGIVATGMSTGMKFITNIYGFDVYVSQNLPSLPSETIAGVSTDATGVGNLFFSAAPDVLPFVGAVRQPPKVDSEFNKDFQREEYVTTARYDFKLYRPENLVTILTNTTLV
jgi:HK97 family phage major capsid protein